MEGGKYGAGIVNNSKTKLKLDLEADEAQYVQDAFKLSPYETRQIRGSERGEGMLIANNSKITISIKASRVEHDFITTDRAELAEIRKRNKSARPNSTQFIES